MHRFKFYKFLLRDEKKASNLASNVKQSVLSHDSHPRNVAFGITRVPKLKAQRSSDSRNLAISVIMVAVPMPPPVI